MKMTKVVLIVDDNLDVVNYVSDILSKFYKVITAENGKIGVEKAMRFIPKLNCLRYYDA